MTVGELIDELAKHSREAKVFQSERYRHGHPVDHDEVMSCYGTARKVMYIAGHDVYGTGAYPPTADVVGEVEDVVILDYMTEAKRKEAGEA